MIENKNKYTFHFWNLGIVFFLFFIIACKKEDKKLIIGKWQNEQDWFDYKADGTYDSGKMMLTMVKGFKYTLDKNKHELNMYTDNENETYYLHYQFISEDTLAVTNVMSSNQSLVKFYRVKKEE